MTTYGSQMSGIIALVLGVITFTVLTQTVLVAGNHLPSHRLDFNQHNNNNMQPDGTLTLNQRFFNDVRALIKRRLKENDETHMDDDANNEHDLENNIIENELATAPQTPIKQNHVPTPVLVENWPTTGLSLGQITAVAIDTEGNPVVFHRADRYWDVNTFNESNISYLIAYGPIREKTVYELDPKTGAIRAGWGEDLFYMPHGLTIDIHGNYWLTDVAMHQVFKFKPRETQAQIVIGKRFKPGSSFNHLCKPTSVAVASTGEFFIADGYCNRRILKFNAAGRLLRSIPQPPEFLSLQVPHAITLLEHLDLLCIADRENMRVVCPKAGLKSSRGEGQPAATIQEPDLGRVFGVAAYGDLVFAVNGPTSMLPVSGFTIDPRSENIVGHWGLNQFKNPHSIAVNVNDSALYVTEVGTNHQTNRIWKYVLV